MKNPEFMENPENFHIWIKEKNRTFTLIFSQSCVGQNYGPCALGIRFISIQ